MKHTSFLRILGFSILLAGCVGLKFESGKVVFEDPYARLGVRPVELNETEKAGIVLRMKPDLKNGAHFREESTTFAQIKDENGKRLGLVLFRNEKYAAPPADVTEPGAFTVTAQTTLEGQKGLLIEEKVLNERGKILKLIRGEHNSKLGKFTIVNWTGTEIFPEEAVLPGAKWAYDEKMDVRIQSRLIKEVDPQPYVLHAESTWEGVAEVGGARCAIIRTVTTQTKEQHFKVLFKEVRFKMENKIEEIAYWDYQKGKLQGRITLTTSHTTGVDLEFADNSQSQSVTIREK